MLCSVPSSHAGDSRRRIAAGLAAADGSFALLISSASLRCGPSESSQRCKSGPPWLFHWLMLYVHRDGGIAVFVQLI